MERFKIVHVENIHFWKYLRKIKFHLIKVLTHREERPKTNRNDNTTEHHDIQSQFPPGPLLKRCVPFILINL